jgi:hypothetical protein
MIVNPRAPARRAALYLLLLVGACDSPDEAELAISWDAVPDRTWAGPNSWANRLQDWEVSSGRLEAAGGQPMRTAHILTARTDPARGGVEVNVTLGLVSAVSESGRTGDQGSEEAPIGAGVLLGAGGPELNWRRAALIHHSPGPGGGLFAGIDTDGRLFVRDFSSENELLSRSETAIAAVDSVDLRIRITPRRGKVELKLDASPSGAGPEPVTLDAGPFEFDRLTGGLSLVADAPGADAGSVWFSRLRVSGRGFENHEERMLGPVLGAQHTLSRGVLTLTAQLFPVAGGTDGADPASAGTVQLEVSSEDGQWYALGHSPVVTPGYTATFRVENWPDDRDVPYRLSLLSTDSDVSEQEGGLPFEGRIRAEPIDEDEIVVAAFTGNHNVAMPGVDRGEFDWTYGVWFPHQDVVAAVHAHDPDLLFFSGDQVYEGASPTAADFDQPYLDYLYKWYLWVWAFRDLTAEIPAVTIPDDHDVFHGNVWGAGGRATPAGLTGAAAQDAGGYKLPAAWVNMVQRTQTSHLPRPSDPEPVEQGIGVYFTDVLYGGVSFGVIEDRKFKSPPASLLPAADVWNGWAQNSDWNAPEQGDPPGAELLGERQERFLDEWAADWSDGAWMKVLLSQTIFANVATIPAEATSGSVIPGLPIPEPGAWVDADRQAADMDSNGWPRSGRDRALRAIRKGFAVHLAGDQHLASTIRYGVDEFGDAGYALCVPSVANFWPRRWYPPGGGPDRSDGRTPGTGEFLDGFGNRMTVLAVSNPARWERDPTALHDRAPGYGIARFNRFTREVSLEAWPRWADPEAGDRPYPGWPVRFRQEDGYGREPWGFLPTLVVEGTIDPVVQVVDPDGEIVYTLRIRGDRFTPRVFEPGRYTVRVVETDTEALLLFPGLEATTDSTRTLEVEFP